MNYLQDRKIKKNSLTYTTAVVVVCVLLFLFHVQIFHTLSFATSIVFRPVLSFGKVASDKLSGLSSYFVSKESLTKEVGDLKFRLAWSDARMSNYETLLAENTELKEVLSRKPESLDLVLASVLSKPSRSAYDTILVDAGYGDGVAVGKLVFAYGSVPIGRVATVYKDSARIILFSSAEEKNDAVINGMNFELVGRGGGNFEVILPRDLVVEKDSEAVLPGISSYPVAVVEDTISDPRDAFQKVILTSPVNIEELRFVEIAK